MALDERLGINAKAYYQSGGTFDSETWGVIDRVENLAWTLQWDTALATDRGTGLKVFTKTVVGVDVTGRVKVNENDTAYLAFVAPSITRTALMMLILNGASNSNGAFGFKGYFHVTMGSEQQGMGDVIYRDFHLTPASTASTTPFKSATVTGGVPVYTALGTPS